MKRIKRILSIIIVAVVMAAIIPVYSFAQDDDGKIDLYKAFSNQNDIMKNQVGSRVYKWSMYLPDDGMVYKSDRANFFNMSTNSYRANIQLMVSKNEDELTLEDILYKMQNNSRQQNNYWIWGDKEYNMEIATDSNKQRYIKVVKTEKAFDHFLIDKVAEEFSDYTENRIYIANNYIYNLTVQMQGEFYRGHQDMFNKLVNSFKTSYDTNNSNIKELSDSVSTTREFKNTSYGWKMTLSPYWKVDGVPNSRNQNFSPVYSDEELNMMNTKDENNDVKITEGITVSLISSCDNKETASIFAQKEIDMIKNNYNINAYEILKNEPFKNNGMDAQRVVIRFKTTTNNPYVVSSLYAVGNGYKYLVNATIKDDKYKDANKRKDFDNMIESFTLDSSLLSKYLGKIVSADTLIDFNATKELKTKKYDFKTKLNKGWDIFSKNSEFLGFDNRYMLMDMPVEYYFDNDNVSNIEFISAFEPASNINISMMAGLNANPIEDIVSDNVSGFLRDSDIAIGIAKVKIQSAEYNGAQIFKISKEYDIKEINDFVNSDKTKIYNLDKTNNVYKYIVKIGKDTFTQTIMIPVSRTSDKNMQKIKSIWENTTINKINYSKLSLNYKDRKLSEFDKMNK
ncbi:MAG: hypothetical protein N2448_05580 [Caloramator sp.]|nr:hypothetical protein [Caloramator sp.]